MEQHYAMFSVSVLFFFLALFMFTTYKIYASVFVEKSFTIRYLFFALAVVGLIIAAGTIICWNR